MKTKRTLRLISLVMLIAAVVFVFCALSNPGFGQALYIGSHYIDKDILYIIYVISMILLFVVSFFVKDKSKLTSNLSFSLNHFGYMELNSSLIPSQRKYNESQIKNILQKHKREAATKQLPSLLSKIQNLFIALALYNRCTKLASKLLQFFTPVYAITPFSSAVISPIRFATASAPCFTNGIRWIPTLTAVAPSASAL